MNELTRLGESTQSVGPSLSILAGKKPKGPQTPYMGGMPIQSSKERGFTNLSDVGTVHIGQMQRIQVSISMNHDHRGEARQLRGWV
jgi:hypothetical protein